MLKLRCAAMPMPQPLPGFRLPQPDFSPAISSTRRSRRVSIGILVDRRAVVRVVDALRLEVDAPCPGPSMSSRNSSGSRPAACAISSAKLCAANAWKLLLTARNQPMRTCASAGPFSARMFGTSYGRSVSPRSSSKLSGSRAPGANVDAIGGNADRCSHAVGLPRPSTDGLVIHRRRRVVVVEVDVVLARPDHLDRLAELLRQHRRFGRVVRLRFPAEAAAEQRHVAGDVLLVDADARRPPLPAPPAGSASAPRPSTLPSRNSATAAGGSIDACAASGV